MSSVTVTSRGRITIPKALRRKLGIRPGSKIVFALQRGRAELRVLSSTKSAYGLLHSSLPAVPVDFDIASGLSRTAK